jgi:nucleotide-binding universal stress UspA family protein
MPTNRFRILVGTDFSNSARLALDGALEQVHLHEPSELHLVSVIDDGSHHLLPESDRHATLTQAVERVRELLTADFAATLARGVTPPQLPPILHVRLGGIAEQLTALAMEIRADLLVVGTHGRRGFRRLIMGSVAERTLRLAPCPVLVVRPKDVHGMDGVPAIEPPCPACLDAREKSEGARWWCAEHEAAPEPAHTYSFSGQLRDPSTPRHHVL